MKKERKPLVLPQGISVVERTKEIEMFGRGREKYYPILEALKSLTGTDCVRIDTTSMGNQVKSFKAGIRHAVREFGLKGKVKFADKADCIFVWINGS